MLNRANKLYFYQSKLSFRSDKYMITIICISINLGNRYVRDKETVFCVQTK